jgi:hypothetical protein
MSTLKEIAERLGGAPSGRQLRFAAIRAGLEVSARQADAYAKGQAENQVFAPRTVSDGRTASRGPSAEYQADLIDFKAQMQTSKVVLLVIDPFNRQLRLSEALPNKKPQTVAAAFLRILERFPTPASISTDSGSEFKQQFETMLAQENIVHKFRRGINSLSVLDIATDKIKKELAKRLLRAGSRRFDKQIEAVEREYNESIHGSIGGAPDDVDDSKAGKILQFHLQAANADAFKHNTEANRAKETALKDAGAFRQVVDREAFMRGDKPKFGQMRRVQKVEFGQVTDTTGKVVSVKEVRAVPASTQDVEIPDTRNRGLRDASLREKLQDFAKDLWDALGDRELAATAAARLMPESFSQTKPSSMLFSGFLKLFPRLFKLTGEGPGMKVSRAARRRIRGKQPAP